MATNKALRKASKRAKQLRHIKAVCAYFSIPDIFRHSATRRMRDRLITHARQQGVTMKEIYGEQTGESK